MQRIFNSIKTKNKLLKKHIETSDHKIKQFFIKYLIKLTHVKNVAKRRYYDSKNDSKKINESKNDFSKIWSNIKDIIYYKALLRLVNFLLQ